MQVQTAVLGAALFLMSAHMLRMPAAAQQSAAAQHVAHLTTSFRGAPENRGLIVTASAEANAAMMHANFAGGDPANLEAMKAHVGDVLRVLDPSYGTGPGLGFGLKPAAEAIIAHIELAMSAEGASPSVRALGPDLAAAARGVIARCDRIIELGERLYVAGSAAEAALLVAEIRTLTLALDTGEGNDLDAGQGGMTHVEAQAYEILSGEGLLRVLH
jgi:hypothetical protein